MSACQPVSVNNILPKQGEGGNRRIWGFQKDSSHHPSGEGEERKMHFVDVTGLPRAGLVYL